MTDTRTHLLTVGRGLAAQRGFTAVGLQELLKAAEVPKGSFYHYFPSKEAYGCALLESFVKGYKADLTQTLDNGALSARDRLLAYFSDWRLKQCSPRAEDRCLVVKLSAEVADLSPGMSAVLRDGIDAIVARLASVLRQGAADGSIGPTDDPEALATTFYQIWLGASLMASLARDDGPFTVAMTTTERLIPRP
ncbi:TetR/AcrR family transcriptional regulator [Aurantimonas marianensis]|uniref:TetR/AcrR family transcriptional regulator n=1 Tax=Aurantimonas marianensis TaxID=2920428 RepID=A0A9X2H728_9HYPH|nr:TetR/AcrR family transcriptional regulator [Aurantimonas marianensis]MCP3055431.1 TetR/AcrR family transcriptional regulator [Aurantimonas marianensis]